MQISHSHSYPIGTQEVPRVTFACLGVAHSSFGAGGKAFTGDEEGAGWRVGRGAQVTGEGLASILGHSIWLSLHTAATHCCESEGNTSNSYPQEQTLYTTRSISDVLGITDPREMREAVKIRTPTCCEAGLGSGSGACTVTPISHQGGGEPNQTIVDAKVHKEPGFRLNITQESALHSNIEMQDNVNVLRSISFNQ